MASEIKKLKMQLLKEQFWLRIQQNIKSLQLKFSENCYLKFMKSKCRAYKVKTN